MNMDIEESAVITTNYHMSINIAGALQRKNLKGILSADDGRASSGRR